MSHESRIKRFGTKRGEPSGSAAVAAAEEVHRIRSFKLCVRAPQISEREVHVRFAMLVPLVFGSASSFVKPVGPINVRRVSYDFALPPREMPCP